MKRIIKKTHCFVSISSLLGEIAGLIKRRQIFIVKRKLKTFAKADYLIIWCFKYKIVYLNSLNNY